MFYLNWKSQLDVLSDKELRRFINNLISWHQNEEIELKTKADLLVWNGVLPGLETNIKKYEESAERSRNNGKKSSGRPPKGKETQRDILEPTKPDNSKLLIDNTKGITDNGEMINENREEEILNRKEVNTGISQGEFLRTKIDRIENILVKDYKHYPFLLSMANPTAIKELKNHIDDKEELDSITSLLKELSESRYKLRGNYD
jgi:hypothetical protein